MRMKVMVSLINKLISCLKKIYPPELEKEEDILNILKQAAQKSLINAETFHMLENTLNLSNLKVRDIMMPRNQMKTLNEKMPLSAIVEIINESGHSRFPVTAFDNNDILGILHAKDLLMIQNNLQKDEFDLVDMLRRANFVPESKKLDALLADFRKNRNHMAIVVDEYGHTIGFVTLEDTIEEIIGEIADEFDVDKEDPIKQLSDNQYIIKGDAEIELINERFGPIFNDNQVDTIGGVVTSLFGYPPKRGQEIDYMHCHFKVISATLRRIKLLEVTITPHEKLES